MVFAKQICLYYIYSSTQKKNSHYMKVQLAQQFNYTMATMEGKNYDAMAETSPFKTSIFFFSITQEEFVE